MRFEDISDKHLPVLEICLKSGRDQFPLTCDPALYCTVLVCCQPEPDIQESTFYCFSFSSAGPQLTLACEPDTPGRLGNQFVEPPPKQTLILCVRCLGPALGPLVETCVWRQVGGFEQRGKKTLLLHLSQHRWGSWARRKNATVSVPRNSISVPVGNQLICLKLSSVYLHCCHQSQGGE